MTAEVKHADGTTWAVTVFTIFEAGTIEALKAWMDEKGVLASDSQLSFWAMKRAWYSEQPGEAGQLGLALLGRAQFLMHEWHRARDGP